MDEAPRKFWPRCRRVFRWCRIGVLLAILVAVGALLYLNLAGVPEFLREQIEAELRSRGLKVQLGRVRLHGLNELSTRDFRLGQAGLTNGPQFLAQEAELRLDPRALRQFELKLDSVGIRQAQLFWPLPSTNGEPENLAIEGIATELHFTENDRWELRRFEGRLLGAQFQLAASITNASVLRAKTRAETKPGRPVDWTAELTRWAARLKKIELSEAANLKLRVTGDAKEPASFRAELDAQTPAARTPWGALDVLQLKANVAPSGQDGSLVQVKAHLLVHDLRTLDETWRIRGNDFTLEAQGSLTNRALHLARMDWRMNAVETPWAQANHVHFTSTTRWQTNEALTELRTILSLETTALTSKLVQARTNRLVADVAHSMTNFTAIDGRWELSVNELETGQGRTENARLSGHVKSPDLTAPGPADAGWGAWSMIDTLDLDWQCALGAVRSPKLQLESLEMAGRWRPPLLALQPLHAKLYGGQLEASLDLNVASRELKGRSAFDFDAQQIRPLLTPASQRWLGQFAWNKPPQVRAEGSLVLPAWTNSQPDWRGEVLPTIRLSGDFEGTTGAFRGVPVSSARSHFDFANFKWRLPDLVVERPEGQARLAHEWEMFSQQFWWRIDSRIDLQALKPMLDPPQVRVLDLLSFSAPPSIAGEVWGRYKQREEVGFNARVAASNFTFKGEHCDELAAELAFTNLFMNVSNVFVRRAQQTIHAPAGGLDFRQRVAWVTNATSTMDPDLVTRLIGPRTRKALAPFQFAQPPSVLVNGRLPLADTDDADVHFQVAGRDFSYWRFRVPAISGNLHWQGDSLSISNVHADFYQGHLSWEGEFDFRPRKGSDFRFRGGAQDASLPLLMADLALTTNKLEGRLTGNLVVTSANSDNDKSWQGYGDVELRDGFLWNIPVFGFISTVLDKVIPGVGQSRVKAGTATFRLKDTVIHTDDLELRSPALRLQYEGQVDLQGRVEASVQAEVLRDAWAVGRVVSLALWPLTKALEYKITGTLAQPKSEPLYIPKIFMFPFHPLRSLREIFQDTEPPPKN